MHTCDRWNDKKNIECGKPAKFRVLVPNRPAEYYCGAHARAIKRNWPNLVKRGWIEPVEE